MDEGRVLAEDELVADDEIPEVPGEPEPEPEPILDGPVTGPDPLKVSLSLRVPIIRQEDHWSPQQKIEMLEEHMLLTAVVQADLSWERNKLREELDGIEDDLDMTDEDVREVLGRAPRTQRDWDEARKLNDPEVNKRIIEKQRRIARLTEEINRQERDSKICSRAYSPYLS